MKFLIIYIFLYFVGTVPTGGHNLIDFGNRETGKIQREKNIFLGLKPWATFLQGTGTTETPRPDLAQITLTQPPKIILFLLGLINFRLRHRQKPRDFAVQCYLSQKFE